MSDSASTPSFDEVSKTDAITGTNAGEDPEMSNASLVNSEASAGVGGADSSETEETDDIGMSAEESPGTGVSDVDLDEADSRADAAAEDSENTAGGEALAGDREELFRLSNDVATNDAVAGETVTGESAPLDETPYQGKNELGDDVDLGETEDR